MKKNFTTFMALMAFLLISARCFAQDPLVPFDAHSTIWGGMFAPQSPEAMAITRYGDHSPDLYHGGISLSIPVFNWSDNLFSVPISLEYSSTGYRPGAACGPEGLDWALNAGGVITREIRGIPDETWSQSYSASSIFNANPSGSDDPMSNYIFPNPSYRNIPDPYEGFTLRGFANWYQSYSPTYASTTQKYIYSGGLLNEFVCGSVLSSDSSILIENEPDVFHFSFLGKSGSFILQPNHSVRFLNCSSPSGELSAEFTFTPTQEGTGSYFTITDGQGIKYIFADTETTSSFDALHGNDEGGAAVSCWRLTSITHPSGKTVSFTYSTDIVSNVSPVVTADHLTISDGTGPGSGHPIYKQWIDDPDYFDTSLIYNTVYEKHLTGINFAGRGSASLLWNSNGRLSSISIYNEDGRLLKSCDLSYYIPKNTTGARHLSLAFLSSVSLSGEGTYTFAYDSANDNCRFPYDSGNTNTDLWYTDAFGYYNSVSLKDLFNYQYSSLSGLAGIIESYRIPNLARTRMGVMTRVVYPAGGRSDFSYEQNNWSHLNDAYQTQDTTNPVTGGLRISRIDSYDENGTQVQCRQFSYTGTDGYSSGVLLQYPNIYFKYHFTSNTPGVVLKVEREAVSTTSSLGFTKGSHIEYLRVVETVSRTAGSSTMASTVHTFNSASSIDDTSSETEYLHDCAVNQTEFTFTNDGTVLDEWQSHGTSFFTGKPDQTTQLAISSDDPQTLTIQGYDLYDDVNGSSFSGKTIYFGRLCERVYNTSSPYLSYSTVSETDAYSQTSYVTTSVSVDSRGRITEVSRPDSFGANLSTTYEYHQNLPGLITKKTVTRGGSAVSSTKYDYTCLNYLTSWYVPSSVSTRLVNGSSFGNWRTDLTFASWDLWGNPCSVTDAAGRTTTWTWGYSGLHPTSCSFTSSGATVQQSWTWIPMVGPDTSTDPSGRTTTHYYDSFGRFTGTQAPDGSFVFGYDYYFPGTGDSRVYSDRTYVVTETYHGGGTATDIVYYDGLGRPLQTVQKQASGNSNTDIIVPTTLDVFGRSLIDQYPYARASNSGALRTNWSYEQEYFYESLGLAGGDDYLFGVEHTYENRPGGRVLSDTLPGYDYYVDFGSSHYYRFNAYNQLSGYSAGTCSGALSFDGDGNETDVWTDREGRTVQEDRYLNYNSKLTTSYSYDDRGNLSYIVQPNGSYFSYSYDALGRQVMKTNPDSGAELFVYDSAGRVVLAHNESLGAQDRWILNTWDSFDCLTRSELISTNLSQSALQAYFPVSGSGTLPSYTYSSIATLVEYGYLRSNGATMTVPSALAFAGDSTASSSDLGASLNLKIYEKVLALPEAGASASSYAAQPYVERAFYYDNLGNVLQTVERNILGGISRISIARDCQGNPMSSTETVTLSSSDNNPTVKETYYGYDGRGRQIYEDVYINGSSVASTAISYDVLGRRASVSGNGLTQTESYDFHGWLSETQATSGNTMIFKESLSYAEAQHATPLHSGTITEAVWQHGNNTPCTYAYSYDGAGRLLGADRYVGSTLDNAWTERGITYDAGSNITAIARYGSSASVPVDNFSMSYSGNTLSSVNNSSYSFDSAGNITYDPLRGLSFSYNLLGKPYAIIASSDEADYIYLADGTKVKVFGESNEDGYAYLGSLVFALSEGDWLFDSTPFYGGQIRKAGSSYVADRFAADHLGSVRALVRNGQVLERNDYYPYGMRHANSSLTPSSANRWRFSAKEIQTTAGVNLIDFGARLYDDRICRWTSQDPLAAKYPAFSPYAYCAGDPVNFVDPDGNNPIVSGLLGGAIDYGFQVYGNYKKGLSGKEALWDNIDIVNVGLSAISPGKKIAFGWKVAISFVANLGEAMLEYQPNSGFNTDISFNALGQAATNTAIDMGIDFLTNATQAASDLAQQEAEDAAKQATHKGRLANNRSFLKKYEEAAIAAESYAQAAREHQVGMQIINVATQDSQAFLKGGFRYYAGVQLYNAQ